MASAAPAEGTPAAAAHGEPEPTVPEEGVPDIVEVVRVPEGDSDSSASELEVWTEHPNTASQRSMLADKEQLKKNPELARLFLDNLLSVDQPEFSHEVMDFLLLHDAHWMQLLSLLIRGEVQTDLVAATQPPSKPEEGTAGSTEAGESSDAMPAAGDPWTWWTRYAEAMATPRHVAGDAAEAEAARTAWKVMHLLTDAGHESELLRAKSEGMAEVLLQTYLPTSKGSFHHAGVVLQYLQLGHPTEVAKAVQRHAHWLVPAMLQYFHEAPVPDTLTQLVTQKHTMTAQGGAGAGAGAGAGGPMGAGMYTPPGAGATIPHSYSSSARATVSIKQAEAVLVALTQAGVLDGLARLVSDPDYSPAHADAAAAALSAVLDYLRRYPVVGSIFAHAFGTAGSATPDLEAAAAALEGTAGDAEAATLPPALRPGAGFVARLVECGTAVSAEASSCDAGVAGNFDGLLDLAGALPRRTTLALVTLRRILAMAFQAQSVAPPDQPPGEMGPQAGRLPTDNTIRQLGGAVAVRAALPGIVKRLARAMVVAHARLSSTSIDPPKRKGRKKSSSAAVVVPPVDVAAVPTVEMPMPHPGHDVKVPLGTFRLEAVQTLAQLASLDADALPEGAQGDHPADVALTALAEVPHAFGAILVWTQEYPHSSMLQAAFLQLVQAVAKRNHPSMLKVIFSKYKLLTVFLNRFVDSFKPAPVEAASPTKPPALKASAGGTVGGDKEGGSDKEPEQEQEQAEHHSPVKQPATPPPPTPPDTSSGVAKSPLTVPAPTPPSPAAADTPSVGAIVASATAADRHASSLNGTVLQVLNTVRLVAAAQPPSSFLAAHLRDHAKWSHLLPLVLDATTQQVRPLAQVRRQTDTHMMLRRMLSGSAGDVERLLASMGLTKEQISPSEGEEDEKSPSIELGSDFAKQLGLGDLTPHEPAVPSAAAAGGGGGRPSDAAASASPRSDGKGKRRGKQRGGGGGSVSDSSSDTDSSVDLEGMD